MSDTSPAPDEGVSSARAGLGQRIQSGAPAEHSLSSRLKGRVVRGLYWMVKHAPSWLYSATVVGIVGLMRLLFWIPASPVRRSARDICKLAARAGHTHDPWTVYRRLTSQIGMALECALSIYRGGIESNLDRFEFGSQALETVRESLAQYDGIVLVVPHTPGGVLSSACLNHEVPTLLLTREDTRKSARSQMQGDVLGRLGVETLMVKGSSPRAVLRTCVEGVRQGKAVVLTADNLFTGRVGEIWGVIFGEPARLGAWVVRIVRHAGVPLLPTYVVEREGRFQIQIGEPLLVDRLEDGVQHYLSYFEERILADPGSWAYLGDRKWRRLLAAAAARSDQADPGP